MLRTRRLGTDARAGVRGGLAREPPSGGIRHRSGVARTVDRSTALSRRSIVRALSARTRRRLVVPRCARRTGGRTAPGRARTGVARHPRGARRDARGRHRSPRHRSDRRLHGQHEAPRRPIGMGRGTARDGRRPADGPSEERGARSGARESSTLGGDRSRCRRRSARRHRRRVAAHRERALSAGRRPQLRAQRRSSSSAREASPGGCDRARGSSRRSLSTASRQPRATWRRGTRLPHQNPTSLRSPTCASRSGVLVSVVESGRVGCSWDSSA